MSSSVRKTLLLSFAENYTILIIGIVGTLIIARLLTPAEIGIFSVGAVLVGIAHVVRDFGVGQYLIQEKELTEDKIRAAFALTLTIAWSMAVLLSLISVPAAKYYREPGVEWVILVLAGNFLLIPFGSVTMAFLRRQMNFAPLYKINTASALANSVTAITLAFLGFGYMSLAWAATAGNIATFAMTAFYRPKEVPWLPSFKEIRNVLSFGSYASGTSVMGEIGAAAPDLIVGKVLGMESVGFLGRATGLLLLFERLIANAIHTVSLPFFSAQIHADKDIKASYLKSMSYTTALSWPFFTFLGVMAYPIIRILYGPQWDAAVPLLQILAISATLKSTFFLAWQLYVALGRIKRQAQLQFTVQTISVGAILLAAPFGLKAICLALIPAALLTSTLHLRFLKTLIGLQLEDIIRATRKSFGVTLLTALAPITVFIGMGNTTGQLWLPLIIAGIGAAAGWFAGIFGLNHEMREEVAIFAFRLREMLAIGSAK